jgi:hypothetical protein
MKNGKIARAALGFTSGVVLTMVLLAALSPRELTIAENTTLDQIVWSFQRPGQDTIINETLESPYFDGGLSANFKIYLAQYIEGVSDQLDHLYIILSVNASVSSAGDFVESARLFAYKDQISMIDWIETEFKFENLSIVALVDGYKWKTQAYIELADVNHTQAIHARDVIRWSFLTPNTESHRLEVAFEIIYYNGTAYNKIVQLEQLNIVGRGEA